LEDDIEEVVHEGWYDGNGLQLTHRLSHCADKLQRWGRKKKRRFKDEILEQEAEMERFRDKRDSYSTARFQEAHRQHAKALIQEEAFWKQRAKMHWLKEGDLNTKFFHMSATARSKVKKIERLKNENDDIITGQQNLCEVARVYFQELFTPKDGSLDPVLSLISPRVSEADNTSLEAPITKEEVRVALFQMHPDKSPALMVSIPLFTRIFGSYVVMKFLLQSEIGYGEVTFHHLLMKLIFVLSRSVITRAL
jgi:hypothetical protein